VCSSLRLRQISRARRVSKPEKLASRRTIGKRAQKSASTGEHVGIFDSSYEARTAKCKLAITLCQVTVQSDASCHNRRSPAAAADCRSSGLGSVADSGAWLPDRGHCRVWQTMPHASTTNKHRKPQVRTVRRVTPNFGGSESSVLACSLRPPPAGADFRRPSLGRRKKRGHASCNLDAGQLGSLGAP
jgi:hypothetical protein